MADFQKADDHFSMIVMSQISNQTTFSEKYFARIYPWNVYKNMGSFCTSADDNYIANASESSEYLSDNKQTNFNNASLSVK